MGFDLDHTSFAVGDALAYATRFRREFGGVPIAGETLPEFRYLLLYAGTLDHGARVELLEPTGPGFLTRYLETSGEGPHHITITVPDLAEAVAGARDLGLKVVGESYDHPGWREAFVMPDDVHGTVIQMASSLHTYPSVAELFATRERDMATMPAVLGATDQFWWTSLWDTEPDGKAPWLGATHLVSSDVQLSRDLFGGVLGGRVDEREGRVSVTWPSGSIQIRSGEPVGVERVERHGAGTDWAIGRCGFTSTG
jgi:catechol 2,3-dioxygenase-like lactoylglutathione lyase family enzyme